MNLLRETKDLFKLYGIKPRKRLGQHFMTDDEIFYRMVSHASIDEEDTVLEVGAGFGFLTMLLSKRCRKVIAVEVDPKLVTILKRQLQNLQNVELREGNILTALIPPFNKVVSTPPYSISSSLLFWLLDRSFDCAILTFQKEFAERLVAPVGGENYGRLTVTTYYRAEVELLDNVPKNVFYPIPEVDSIIVRVTPRKHPPFIVHDEKMFFQLVQILFTQRNKKMRNVIFPFLFRQGIVKEKASKLADSLTFHDKRVRQFTPEELGALTNEIFQKCLF